MIVRQITYNDTRAKFFLILGIPLLIYIFESSPLISFISVLTYNAIIKPLLWIGVALIIRYLMNSVGTGGKLKLSSNLKTWALNCAIIYIFISLSGGLIDGFGKSPYDHSLTGTLLNVWSLWSLLIGREFARSYLVNKLTNKENYLFFLFISLFMTITNIPFNKFMDIHGTKDAMIFLATYLGPELCENLLASYLVFIGGPLTSIIYLGVIGSFEWLSPVLPNLKWITKGAIGIGIPVFQLLIISNWYQRIRKLVKPQKNKQESILGWILTCLISVSMLWFVFGVFPIYPSAIVTGSMEPMIMPGDVILVKKIKDMAGIDKLKTGDIIQFKRDDILICHRIIEIHDEKGTKSFKTKGDNNSSSDGKIVKVEDVKGIITNVVPKIGLPTLLFKSRNDIPIDKVVF